MQSMDGFFYWKFVFAIHIEQRERIMFSVLLQDAFIFAYHAQT